MCINHCIKEKEDIIRAHDMIIDILRNERSSYLMEDPLAELIAKSSAHVLCWILGHKDDPTFAEFLAYVEKDMNERGFDLVKTPSNSKVN